MKLLIMQSSPASHDFLPLRSFGVDFLHAFPYTNITWYRWWLLWYRSQRRIYFTHQCQL